jgi:hypothetical protein
METLEFSLSDLDDIHPPLVIIALFYDYLISQKGLRLFLPGSTLIQHPL